MAQDNYKPQLTLIKGGKVMGEKEPPESLSGEEKVAWYRERAEKGNPDAQYRLAYMYIQGGGVPKDVEQAVEWGRKAAEGYHKRAERGDMDAQYRLGNMCELSCDWPERVYEALKWYKKAAEQGHVAAQYELGVLYNYDDGYYEYGSLAALRGYFVGFRKNKKLAAEWFCKAAEGYRKLAECGDVDAQFRLGLMYWQAHGVPFDTNQMRELWHKAADGYRERAERGDAQALKQLRWMAKLDLAANAQYHLGVLAETGDGGVRKNRMHASAWYRKAAKQGHEKAKEALERLNS